MSRRGDARPGIDASAHVLSALSPRAFFDQFGHLGPVRRTAATAATVLLLAGFVTIDWERFANVALGPYNVKLPSMLFSLSAVLCLPLLSTLRRFARNRVAIALVATLGALAVYLVVRALLSADVRAALPQIAATITGAVAPGFAVITLCTTLAAVGVAARWYLAGAVVASVYGFYQLTAFYLGLPQGIVYTGVGTDGLVGRISAFSYEPAYFAYYIVLGLGLTIMLDVLRPAKTHLVLIALFALVLTLANVRALVFLAPLLVVLLVFRARRYRRAMFTLLVAAAACAALTVMMPSLIGALRQTETPSGSNQAAAPVAPAPSTAAPTRATATSEPTPAPGLLDPNEPSSNAPRLSVYRTVLGVAQRQLVFGAGLGNLQIELQSVEPPPPNIDLSKPVVANNIWLEALVDGGVLAVLLQLGAVVLMGALLFKRWATAVFPVVAAWLAVILVGGMLTSYFFDIKIWVVAGLVVSALPAIRRAASGEPAEPGDSL
ncbi:O-antigen ligase family protein [Amnibacterium kyonggiense]